MCWIISLLKREDITPAPVECEVRGSGAGSMLCRHPEQRWQGTLLPWVTLPMNKEATQKSDPHFVGHTELIGAVCGVADVTIMLASEQLIVYACDDALFFGGSDRTHQAAAHSHYPPINQRSKWAS